ncbi:dTDP-4-dehydrorhamnose reductase [Listeria monocytogenes]|uniref:dTDP-4-dehydrorhamnose reductase n=1 Tax=Listeria monocytogenes TaxID=1639 RepID=UPI000BDE7CF7|nr:dTDP-4-dehydrorhamnose reductase [Listeria monocytogenes]PCV93291.1 dTDP-4-dehydrorhamnose reductase [Listeria monocytogenes]HAC5484304.1 dTDP-4-dehydrorhamnose reductase [Listeria monocytogenes]HAC5696101.1 dTDP-4-dehydrorhamnose reductase [Listeria monocytogenes]HAC5734463.1 dTDP-4-dehydrorhamnose reductase [Listeria monocytogenes]
MSILVTGANGQLGTELVQLLKEHNLTVTEWDKDSVDIVDKAAVKKAMLDLKPEWIIHCAAFTNVEAAEDELKNVNWEVNVDGTENISEAAEIVGAKLVYISTDYVFDGTKKEAYLPDDKTNPLNQYGIAKLAGEKVALEKNSQTYVIRTSWVFGKYGNNFVYSMLKLAETHKELKVVNDQLGRPTYTYDLADFIRFVIKKNPAYGIYQFSNSGTATWFEFATEILKDKDVTVNPCTSDEFPQKAERPKTSIMSLEKVEKLGFNIPTWQDALVRFKK